MKDRYRDRKTKRHCHFSSHYNGPEDWDKILENPCQNVSKDEWKKICELFTSPHWVEHSKKNKDNRAQQKYATTQGSKSLAARRHEKVREKTNTINFN